MTRYCGRCGGAGFIGSGRGMAACPRCAATGKSKEARAAEAAEWRAFAAKERARTEHERRIIEGEIDGDEPAPATPPPPPDCPHDDTQRIGEIGGRFQDEWCRRCGALKSWDTYVSDRERAPWQLPERAK